jgi:hypothetical protein
MESSIQYVINEIKNIKTDSSSLFIYYTRGTTIDTVYWENDKLFCVSRDETFKHIEMYDSIESFVIKCRNIKTLIKQKNGTILLTVEFFDTQSCLSKPSKVSNGFRKFYYTPLDVCSICLENLNESLCVVNCNHVFHENCISKLEKCPLCKYEFDKIEFVSEEDILVMDISIFKEIAF